MSGDTYLVFAAVMYFVINLASAYNDDVKSDLLSFADQVIRSLLWPLLIVSSIAVVFGIALAKLQGEKGDGT